MLKQTLLITLACFVVSCGTGKKDTTTGSVLASGIADRLKSWVGPKTPAEPDAPLVITRATFKGVTEPAILVTIPKTKALSSISIARANGAIVTWISPDNVSVVKKDHIVSATRGFGDDLISSDLRGVRAALAARGGSYERSYQFMNQLNELRTQTYRCVMTSSGQKNLTIYEITEPATHLTEVCENEEGGFQNDYWVRGNRMLQSQQWVSPTIGHLFMQRVV